MVNKIKIYIGVRLLINEKNSLYEQFLNYSYKDLKELFKNAKTREEQDFYILLSDIVLQKEQKIVIGKEL